MPKRLPYKKFVEIYSQVTRLTVLVVIKTNQGVVLTKRGIEPYKGMWHIPGGTVFMGETLEDTVGRVAKEELGVSLKTQKSVGPIYYPEEIKIRGYGWTVGIVFVAETSENIPQQNKDREEIGIFAKIPSGTIKEDKEFIEKYIL